jgi:signal transduction histidine kinase
LTALKLNLSSIRRSLDSHRLPELSATVREAERAVNRIIGTVRKIATELRPGILDELGIAAAIEWLAKDFQHRTGLECTVATSGVDRAFDTARTTAVFRIVQEALTNVTRHAKASRVHISLEKEDETLILEVRDDGIGLPEERVPDSNSLGLIGIRERVLLLGGETAITGARGEGTLVRVTLPLGYGGNPDA